MESPTLESPGATAQSPTASWREHVTRIMRELALTEGYTASAIEGVRLMRANRPLPRAPVLYEPSIVVVCQGTKRGFLHGHSFTYDPLHYLVLSAPLPFEAQTFASAAEPLLAISMRIDLTVAAELALALGDPGRGAPQPQGICAAPLDDRLGDAVLRLLQASQCPVEATVMGPVILREIYFRVLTGENGNAIRAALAHHSHFSKINKALRTIHAQFSEGLSVSALANEAGMSLAAFHASFKAVTATSPIQYLKATRLHKARLLMVQDGLNASVAAGRVGYESASQFSREFKRFFGRSPVEEATHMSQLVAVMPGLQGGAQRLPMPAPQRYVIVD